MGKGRHLEECQKCKGWCVLDRWWKLNDKIKKFVCMKETLDSWTSLSWLNAQVSQGMRFKDTYWIFPDFILCHIYVLTNSSWRVHAFTYWKILLHMIAQSDVSAISSVDVICLVHPFFVIVFLMFCFSAGLAVQCLCMSYFGYFLMFILLQFCMFNDKLFSCELIFLSFFLCQFSDVLLWG